MNQSNDLFNVLTIYNPSNEPFEVKYNDEVHKVIQPHKAIRIVKMIAGDSEHGNIKHLVDRMIRQSEGSAQLNNPQLRADWTAVIVRDSEANGAPVLPTLEQQAKELTQQLNEKPVAVDLPSMPLKTATTQTTSPEWKFDPLTGEPIVKKPNGITPQQATAKPIEIQMDDPSSPVPEIPLPTIPHPDAETNTILESMRVNGEEGGRVLKVDDDGEEAPIQQTPKTRPTREQLFDFMKNNLLMAVDDPKTRNELEAKTDDELIEMTRYYEVAE